MSAIERCRTAALGGHVARCENDACGHTVIGYNSCRNRHCPKCQGAAATRWLAAREAELLPVATSMSSTRCRPSARRRLSEQARDLRPALKAAAETTLTIAADPKRLGARIGITAVLHTWGSALTHHPHVHMIVPGGGLSDDGSRWISSRSNFLVHVNVLAALVPRQVPDDAHRMRTPRDSLSSSTRMRGSPTRGPSRGSWRRCARSNGWSTARTRSQDPSRCCAISPATPTASPSPIAVGLGRRQRRRLPLEGLPHRRARPLEDDDAPPARVHPALPDARAAQGLPPHPPLRPVRQWQPRRQHRTVLASCSVLRRRRA